MAAPHGRCDGGTIPLPILPASGGGAPRGGDGPDADSHAAHPRVRASRSTRWRFAVLGTVQAIMILHVIQWLWQGSTISPVEPSEAMETSKTGLINAGTVFFAMALASTVVLGRFFCGWGCHVLLLQDGCAWILKRLGIRPKPFRARLLMLIPLALALYMFVWPLAYRWAIAPYLQPNLAPMEWRREFITSDFWSTFPGVMVAIPFLFVCGALTVYFLGQKGYCTYACPYGGFFAPIDRIAPLRIRVNDSCEHCGHCTAVCTSNVRVHEEVAKFGMVVDPGCMKCLDCVSVCPNEALSVSWGKPATMARPRAGAEVGPPGHRHPIADRAPDLSMREEVAVLAVGAAALLAVNAPFMPAGAIKVSLPLLFSSGIAAIVAFLAFKSWRLLARRNDGFHGMSLRRNGRVAAAGWAWLAMTALALGTVSIVGAQNLALTIAHRADRSIDIPAGRIFTREAVLPPDSILATAAHADRFYEFASLVGRGGIGFVPPVQPWIDVRRAWLAAVRRDFATSEAYLRTAFAALPEGSPLRPDLAADIGRVLWVQGQLEELDSWSDAMIAAHPHSLHQTWERFHRDRVAVALLDAAPERAIGAARAWVVWDPTSLEAMRSLSLLLVEKGSASEIDEGLALVERTLEIEPGNPGAYRALAIGHARAGRLDDAEKALLQSVEHAPDDWRFWQGLGEFYRGTGREQEASRALDRATRLRESVPPEPQ